MPWADELVRLQRRRSVFLDFSAANNPGVDWLGDTIRLFGKFDDSRGPIPIKGTVDSFGTFNLGVTNHDYDFEQPSLSIALLDPNNEWRILAAPPSDTLLYRWLQLFIRVIDDDDVVWDSRVAVGQILAPQFPPGKRVQLDTRLTGGAFLGELIPRRLVNLRDFPRAAPEEVNKAVPIIYGVMSNTVINAIGDEVPGGSETGGGGPCESLESLWEDDFESGTLGANYDEVSNVTVVAGAGTDGSAGLVGGVGNDSYVHKIVDDNLQSGCLTLDYLINTTPPVTFRDVVQLENPDFEFQRLWQLMVTDTLELRLVVLNVGSTDSAAGVISLATYHNIRVVWNAPSEFGLTDGTVTVYVDGNGVITAPFGISEADSDISWMLHVAVPGSVDNIDLRGGETTPGTPGSPDYNCTTVEAGTGPNMGGGAIRALLVDRGITSSVSVETEVPRQEAEDTSIAAPPDAAANAIDGGGVITAPLWFFVAAIRDGIIGTLTGLFDLDNGFDPDYPAHAAAINWNELPGGADEYIVWMTQDFNFHPFTNPDVGNARTRVIPGSPQTGSVFGGKDFEVIFTSIEDGDIWTIPTETTTGTATGFTGWRYLLAGHWLRRITEVFVLRPVTTTLPPEEEGGEPISTTVDMQVLQQEGTDFVQEIIEINGNRYHTIRFFASQQTDDCTRQYEVTANVEGIEDNADGTGNLITEFNNVVRHFLLNWVFNNYRSSTGPYAPTGGRWFTDVPYAPGLLDADSFVEASGAGAERMGPLGNYRGSGALTEQITGAQLIAELMRTFDLDFYFDPVRNFGNGAWCVKMFRAGAVVRANLSQYTPTDSIFVDTFESEFDLGVHANVIPYFAGPMTGRLADTSANINGGFTVAGEVRDPESIQRYGEVMPPEALYLRWTRHAATAYNVAYHRLLSVRYPPIMARCSSPIGSILDPIASEIAITHPDGISSDGLGWTQRVCRIMRADMNLDQMIVTLLLRDVDALVP